MISIRHTPDTVLVMWFSNCILVHLNGKAIPLLAIVACIGNKDYKYNVKQTLATSKNFHVSSLPKSAEFISAITLNVLEFCYDENLKAKNCFERERQKKQIWSLEIKKKLWNISKQ